MKYSAFTFIAFIAVIFAACVHGWLPDIIEEVEPPQSEELVIDSCQLTPYSNPQFVCITQRETADLPTFADFKWRGEVRSWIFGGFQFANPSSLVIDIINEVGPSYSQAFVIDNSTTDNGVMNVQYVICFTNPQGLWSEGVQDKIYLEWLDHRQAVAVLNSKAMWLDDIPIDANQVDNILDALPSFKKFGMNNNGLDSASIDLIHESILSGCKTGLTVDTSDMPMSAERLEQYMYQQITLQ